MNVIALEQYILVWDVLVIDISKIWYLNEWTIVFSTVLQQDIYSLLSWRIQSEYKWIAESAWYILYKMRQIHFV